VTDQLDLTAWRAAADAIHTRHIVLDGHSDVPLDLARRRQAGEQHVFEARHWPKMQAGGLTGEVVAVYSDAGQLGPQVTRAALEGVDAVWEEAAETPDRLAVALQADDFAAAKQAGRHAMLLGLEGGAALNGRLALLRTFYRLGVRWLGLTWNFRNELADGCGDAATGGGLTRFGVEAVKLCQRLGVIVDVSHLAEAGVDRVLELADGPVIASHANARAVTNHIRNLTDRHLDGIARTGGVVGVVFFAQFVHADPEAASLRHVLDHVDYLKRRIGVEHISIGPDYTDYVLDLYTSGGSSMAAAGVYTHHFHCAAGVATAAELRNLTAGLLSRGYAEPEIAAILGGNLLRVIRQVVG